jgi:putative spermidine/putrescine transport system ATP-binding protein
LAETYNPRHRFCTAGGYAVLLKVLDNVAYGLKQRGFSKEERHERARAMLELVRLPAVEERKPKQLSGGQQQRVALARARPALPKPAL